MEDQVRQAAYEAQTAESYRLLGEFVAEFELLMFTMRSVLEREIGGGPGGQLGVQALTVELTAWPLSKAFNSYALCRITGNTIAQKAIRLFKDDFQKLIETRNDLVHGTHFIGWVSQEQVDFSKPEMLRLKNKKGGVSNANVSISHDSMAAYIVRAKRLNQVAIAIGVHLLLNKWEAQFDSSGAFRFEI
ncbi:MAG: hypothetical protein RL036_568 [Actinomycetota bacterium]|jgi:hypothetical protein